MGGDVKKQLFLAALLLPFFAHADQVSESSATDTKPDRGWFFYEKESELKPNEEKKAESQKQEVDESKKSESKAEKHPVDVAWLRKNLPILQDRAIDSPTRENLAAYYFARRAMMDKSQRYSEAAQQFVYSEPMLDENNRVPQGQANKDQFLNAVFKAKQASLKYLAGEAGLFMFFESTCEFCATQARTINTIAKHYNFTVKYISVDGKGMPETPSWVPDNGHARMLDLKVYPTTVLVVPPKTYLIVSQGMMANDQLEDRILTAAQSSKLLPDDMAKNINPWDRGVLTPEDLQDGASDNVDDFVANMREKLKKRY